MAHNTEWAIKKQMLFMLRQGREGESGGQEVLEMCKS